MIYKSHKNKTLSVHTQGVIDNLMVNNTGLDTACLFHDTGKINYNFQKKLFGETKGYTHHAYLSAYIFFCFCHANPEIVKDKFGMKTIQDFLSVAFLISQHHVNLKNMTDFLKDKELSDLMNFLDSNPNLPASDFIKAFISHKPFQVQRNNTTEKRFKNPSPSEIKKYQDKLNYYMKIHSDFASLIEADKKDASDNNQRRKTKDVEWINSNWLKRMSDFTIKYAQDSEINSVRTQIRNESIENIKPLLEQGQRVFSLTAPTGSGKTTMLLSLAGEIRKVNSELTVKYILPFLTITEQVTDICKNAIFSDNPNIVQRIDSRSENTHITDILQDLEKNPDKVSDLLKENFSSETFDGGFIVTTFQQLFESFFSNVQSRILKIPNFHKTVFLIDEIQSLPPRLYVFLTAYLDAFCKANDCYAIISTATMPTFKLPEITYTEDEDPKILFSNYNVPENIIDFKKYYNLPVFNRYQITRLSNRDSLYSASDVAIKVSEQQQSLVILNTISDSRAVYDLLCQLRSKEEVVLLNTCFTLKDRRDKIKYCQDRLNRNLPIILVSTQLIEAGVDIDFPVVFRDMCPLPNLIQSAGRCNRNGKFGKGSVFLFEMCGENGFSRSEIIYGDMNNQWILDFTRSNFAHPIDEKNLMDLQERFFGLVNTRLVVGRHELLINGNYVQDNLIKRINNLEFETMGSFRLINNNLSGLEYRYYIPENADDKNWQRLKELVEGQNTWTTKFSYDEKRKRQIEIEVHVRKMEDRTVLARVKNETDTPDAVFANGIIAEPYNIRCLLNSEDYTYERGIRTTNALAF